MNAIEIATHLNQGNQITTALQNAGYKTERIAGQLSWQIYDPAEEWLMVLTWLPPPVRQWRLLPPNQDPRQQAIYKLIEQTIGGRR